MAGLWWSCRNKLHTSIALKWNLNDKKNFTITWSHFYNNLKHLLQSLYPSPLPHLPAEEVHFTAFLDFFKIRQTWLFFLKDPRIEIIIYFYLYKFQVIYKKKKSKRKPVKTQGNGGTTVSTYNISHWINVVQKGCCLWCEVLFDYSFNRGLGYPYSWGLVEINWGRNKKELWIWTCMVWLYVAFISVEFLTAVVMYGVFMKWNKFIINSIVLKSLCIFVWLIAVKIVMEHSWSIAFTEFHCSGLSV